MDFQSCQIKPCNKPPGDVDDDDDDFDKNGDDGEDGDDFDKYHDDDGDDDSAVSIVFAVHLTSCHRIATIFVATYFSHE